MKRIILLLLLLAGCGGDDDPRAPPADAGVDVEDLGPYVPPVLFCNDGGVRC